MCEEGLMIVSCEGYLTKVICQSFIGMEGTLIQQCVLESAFFELFLHIWSFAT